MSRRLAFAVIAAFGLGGAAGMFALLAYDRGASTNPPRPAWTEVPWPFPTDQWGRGRAFRCRPADCGAVVDIYLRAKLGACNCSAGVADDDALDRMSDLDLVGAGSPLGAGRPIMVGHMKGRSRAYALRDWPGKAAISVAFSDRCDMIATTVVLSHDQPAAVERGVIAFLNRATVLRCAKASLGI